ncbi:MAG: NAD(P)-binding domain-containing protein [Blastocatellia bacterium]
MAGTNRFFIKRKDIEVDDAVFASEGLTIGRLITNDLVLNHRTVSRTHAGIKEINGEFWIFNLSASNGTLLNGELVDKTPLADGDAIQIGRYILLVNYEQEGLSIAVEMEMDAHGLEGRTGVMQAPTPADESGAATMKMEKLSLNIKKYLRGASKKNQGTGMLTGILSAQDEEALKVFWEKRKREAGKIAEKTPLRPKSDRRVGKIQFNWRPTRDLRKLWRKSYFIWGAVIVGVLSVAALAVYNQVYSPGAISAPHISNEASTRDVSLRPNNGSCSECHSPASSIQSKCVDCHTTHSFEPAVSKAHTEAGLECASCHGEHMGTNFRPGLVGSGMCVSCHNDTSKFKGRVLGIPHGGTVGYPAKNGIWDWAGLSETSWKNKELADTASKYTPVEQFHILHVSGREGGRTNCTDCHAAGLHTEEGLRQSPRATCAACHSISFDAGKTIAGPNCTSCHAQHGEDKEMIASLRHATIEGGPQADQSRAENIPWIGAGGAQVIRHDETGARWSFETGTHFGALPWYGWAGLIAALPVLGIALMVGNSVRRRYFLKIAPPPQAAPEKAGTKFLNLAKLQAEGPAYPHPVVDPLLCIGCHACVEACPHDVLAIVNGVSTPVALDQCMEDTACTVECPTSPKACIVINTNKKIPARKVPNRNQRLMTNVPGIYMIGDVSGVPLIKNALNEGAQVIDYIVEDLQKEGKNPKAEYDVAIIGVGPAGISATSLAKQRGLSYIAIEQDKVVSTIQNYPAGKYVFFKPDTVEAKGGMPLEGAGNQREFILETWMKTMLEHGLQINEDESCKDIKQDDGIFTVVTEQGKLKEKATYKVRAVILAIGNRGTPMKLRVPGEELKFKVMNPQPVVAKHCPKCGQSRKGSQLFCVKCGQQLPARTPEPYEDTKVKYKVSDPADYVNKKCIIVGAGNSSIESAVDLTGFKRDGDEIKFTRNNEVTLVVRSDFKGDLKLGNKMNVYDCIDAGKIKVFFRTEIKEITETEVVLMDVRTKEEKARLANDYVFALIGGEKPTKFLEGIGIKIG